MLVPVEEDVCLTWASWFLTQPFQNLPVKVTFTHAILKISEAMRAQRGKLLKDRNGIFIKFCERYK